MRTRRKSIGAVRQVSETARTLVQQYEGVIVEISMSEKSLQRMPRGQA
jgi:hypothetical protein